MTEEIDKEAALAELAGVIKNCKKCAISQYRHNAVVGEGDPYSGIMFIGEAPGKNEDEQGRPFVGNAGKFLDTMLEAAGLSRESVYITNVIKTRPPENRDPAPDEIANCKTYLDRQIEIIKPKIIVTLGRYSMGMFLPGFSISRVHGQPYMKKDGICYMPMYHPAATLHQPGLREIAIKDMLKLPKLIELLKTGDLRPSKKVEPSAEKQIETVETNETAVAEEKMTSATSNMEEKNNREEEIQKSDFQMKLF